MSGLSWFNTANGGTITPTTGASGGGLYQFSYFSFGNIQLTMPFGLTASGYQIMGYYFWWDGTDAVTLSDMALWKFTSGTWSAVANSDVSAGSLSSGWNFLQLNTPIVLQTGVLYAIVTNQTGGFFDNSNFFNDFPSGITNSVLTLYGPNNYSRQPNARRVQRGFRQHCGKLEPISEYEFSEQWLPD